LGTNEKNKIKYMLKNKKIALLGLGLENQSLLNFLKREEKNINITICDRRDKKTILQSLPKIKKYKNIEWQNGENFNVGLNKFDILFRSPGWPINCPGIQEALKNKKTELSSPMNFFFAKCPSKNIIGVSGTKGKGTTSSLIYEIIKKSGKKCFLGGNIGIAPIDFLNKIKKNDWIVLELSSFQLEDLHISPKIGVLTNLFKEHLSPADPNNPNFHKNISAYLKAKLNLALHQNKNDYLVINKKLKNKIASYHLIGKKIYFSKSKTKSSLVGDFNKENIAAAEKVANILKIKKEISDKVINNFSNLNHRLEFVREFNQVNYYDNSFATTPESTVLDLKSFKKNIILIAGGADKGASFKELAKEIKQRVNFLILLSGFGTDKIKIELKKIKYTNWQEVNNMPQAVKIAKDKAKKNYTVLLSTACASFGLFKNYKERGNLFQLEVKKIK
jgi:UDP-N-acetylmuramoylalanine--D-glutamate ligase